MKRLIIGFGLTLALLSMLGALDPAQAAGLTSSPPARGQVPPGPDGNIPVWRVQIYLQVCDVANAGTDNKVLVALNNANYTVMDKRDNDFDRASGEAYDLLLTGVARLADISHLKISKGGSDGVCLSNLWLYVNERLIYGRTFPTLWVDNTCFGCDSYVIPGTTLRAHSAWQAWTAPSRPRLVSADEIGWRLTTAVGTGMYDFNVQSSHSLNWDSGVCGGLTLCVKRLDGTAIVVELALRYKCIDPVFGDGGCGDALVVYDQELRFSCSDGALVVTKEDHYAYTLPTGDAGMWSPTADNEIGAVRQYVTSRLAEAFRNIKFATCPTIIVSPVDTQSEIRAEVNLW